MRISLNRRYVDEKYDRMERVKMNDDWSNVLYVVVVIRKTVDD